MRIAYVSHVDSRWIKQRPHFIAESMQELGHSVTYVSSNLVRKNLLVRSQRLTVPVMRVPILPHRLRRRLGALDPLLAFMCAAMILVRIRPKAVFFTHARHHRLASFIRLAGVRIFYDCMDLNGLFADATPSDAKGERALVNASQRIFCSSQPIAEHIRNIAPGAKVDVVPNALNQEAFANAGLDDRGCVPMTIGYVGAISSWFDFDSVLQLLDAKPEVTVRLWGPCDLAIPEHERLEYLGIVPHDVAIRAMQRSAVLLLPFRITDLILAVDPVKVYEYIATGRPVIAANYPQLSHFGDWISRYDSPQEMISLVERHIGRPTLSLERLAGFVAANNWTVRAKTMVGYLD